MRIKTLKLKNFQKHSELQIDFSPRITTIQGRSDVGKSSIMRALRWVLLNDFAGEDFIKAGTKEAEVTASLFMGTGKDVLDLKRGKGRQASKNEYDLEGSIFRSFGNGVPDQITKLTQVNEINFQSQHDAPFWFGLSAGEVSRRLNAVIDLSVIDQALFNINQAARKAVADEEVCERRLKEVETNLEEMQDAEKRIEDYKRLRKSRKEYEDSKTNFDQLEAVLQDIRSNKCSELEQKSKEAARVLETACSGRALRNRVTFLSNLLIDIVAYSHGVKEPPDFKPLEQLYSKYQKQKAATAELHEMVALIQNRADLVEEHRQELAAHEDTFKEQSKGICPTCRRPLHA